jgi:hypothetical protein
MNKNSVVCAIEYALREEGCNEIPFFELYERVKKTRGNFALKSEELLLVLKELASDGLFEFLGPEAQPSESSLICRSQNHPSVSYGKSIEL